MPIASLSNDKELGMPIGVEGVRPHTNLHSFGRLRDWPSDIFFMNENYLT